MKKLQQQLWAVVKEYTRQFAELMNSSEPHWIGTNDNGNAPASVLDVGNYFYSFEEVQMVIDNLDKWVKTYGSREAVAQEIKDWQDWWLDDMGDKDLETRIFEVWSNKSDRYYRLRPRINLEHWLMGCPREPRQMNDIDILYELRAKYALLEEMCQAYRSSRSIGNILSNIGDKIKAIKNKINENEQATNA